MSYLTFLSQLVYDNAPIEDGRAFVTANRPSLERCIADGFAGVAWRRLAECEELEEDVRNTLKALSQKQLVRSMREEVALKQLYAEFEREQIRFCPIKGIDLAFRVYPCACMRPYLDWDVLFHPADVRRAQDYLKGHGWQEIIDGAEHPDNHHYPPLVRDNHMIEPHWTLPHFRQVPAERLWDFMQQVEGTSCQFRLTPELNLLMVVRHAAEAQYRAVPLARLLLDAAFIIERCGVDWPRLQRLCRDMALPYPGNLLAAFPEFFPAEVVAAMAAAPEQVNAYREVFRARHEMAGVSSPELFMYDRRRFSWKWLRHAVAAFGPRSMRERHELAPRGEYGRLVWAYVREVVMDAGRFCRSVCCPRRKVVAYLDRIRVAEKVE